MSAPTVGSVILFRGAERTITEVRTDPRATTALVRLDGSRAWHRIPLDAVSHSDNLGDASTVPTRP